MDTGLKIGHMIRKSPFRARLERLPSLLDRPNYDPPRDASLGLAGAGSFNDFSSLFEDEASEQ